MDEANKDEHIKKDENREKDDLRKKALLAALEKSLGVVTTACEKTKVGRTTFYKWYKEDPEFKKSVEDLSNVALDFAESKLFKQIQKGNVSAIIFYLKTKGKKRGYTEKTTIEHEGNKEKPVNIINLGAGIKPKE